MRAGWGRCRATGRPQSLQAPRGWHAPAPRQLRCAAIKEGGPRCITSTVRGGVPKLCLDTSDVHCGTVPLLDVRKSGLPFAATLEFVCSCSERQQLQADAHQHHHHQSAMKDVVELVYVLSGQGSLVEAHTGISWPVQPGFSVVTLARSTYLLPDTESQLGAGMHNDLSPHSAERPWQQQAQQAVPLAVLKFFLPLSLLTGSPTAQLTATQVESLVQASAPVIAPGEALQAGVLADAQALKLLKAVWHASTATKHSSREQHGRRGHSLNRASHVHILGHVALLPQHVQHALAHSVHKIHHHAEVALQQLLSGMQQATAGAQAATSEARQNPFLASQLVPMRMAAGAQAGYASTSSNKASPPTGTSSGSKSHAPSSQQLKRTTGAQQTHRHDMQPAGHITTATAAALSLFRSGSEGSGQCVLMARAMEEFKTFRMPKQTNQLAFVFDPLELGLNLSFGLEIFEPGHHTPVHVHKTGYELFFILSGEGDAYCDGHHLPVRAGDCIVFPPGTRHGLDNLATSKLYAIQMMCPDDEFVSFVQTGTSVQLQDEDICTLTARAC